MTPSLSGRSFGNEKPGVETPRSPKRRDEAVVKVNVIHGKFEILALADLRKRDLSRMQWTAVRIEPRLGGVIFVGEQLTAFGVCE